MSNEDVDVIVKQLHANLESVTVINISQVVMIIPRRIILKAGVNKRYFWEAECSQLNPPGPYQED